MNFLTHFRKKRGNFSSVSPTSRHLFFLISVVESSNPRDFDVSPAQSTAIPTHWPWARGLQLADENPTGKSSRNWRCENDQCLNGLTKKGKIWTGNHSDFPNMGFPVNIPLNQSSECPFDSKSLRNRWLVYHLSSLPVANGLVSSPAINQPTNGKRTSMVEIIKVWQTHEEMEDLWGFLSIAMFELKVFRVDQKSLDVDIVDENGVFPWSSSDQTSCEPVHIKKSFRS